MDWMLVDDAMRFFGLSSVEEVEDAAVEFNLPVLLGESGELTKVGAVGLKEALFTLHERKVGHRPDSPEGAEHARNMDAASKKKEDDQIERHGKALAAKVAKRGPHAH